MGHDEIGAALDRGLRDMEFDERMREGVRRRAAGPVRTQKKRLRPAVAAAVVCAVLLTAAVAAAPTVWELIQSHLGEKAPYAAALEGEAVDQGIALKPVSAMADRNLIRVYFTLKDLEGDRLDETCEIRFRASDDPAINGGGPLELVGKDPDTGETVFCQTRYAQACPDSMTLSIQELRPGYRPFRLMLDGAELDELVPRETLKSAEDGQGRTYLLPGQTPMSLDRGPDALPEGEAPGVSISSMGFAGDGRLHVRFDVDEAVTPMEDWSLSLSGGMYALGPTPVEGGLDYAFPPDVFTRDDLADTLFLLIRGAYSTQGAPLAGDWTVTLPLEPAEQRALTAPAAPLSAAWLSPLSLSVDITPASGEAYDPPAQAVVVLTDGTRQEVPLFRRTGTEAEGRAIWAFDRPIVLDQVASVELDGETLTYAQ